MPVRRALAVALALPVFAAIYLSVALRRGPATRIALALGVGALIVVAAVAAPTGTVGVPTATQAPLAASALGPAVTTGRGLTSPLLVDFDAAMDAASVANAVQVEPPSEVRLSWSEDGLRLAVEPLGTWRPATLYTVTVGTAAHDREGRALTEPLRAGFLTRAATTARLAVTDDLPSGAAVDTSIVISFDRPVPVAGVLRAFRIVPAVPGELLVATDGPEGRDPTVADNFLWEPSSSLVANTRYTVDLAPGLLDAEGGAVVLSGPLVFTTTTAPSVVRFRPLAGTEDVSRGLPVSVRFTMPMDRASTAAAFSADVNGKEVRGTIDFAENDTVLVFDPAATLPYEAIVILGVGAGARAADGTPLDRPRAARFTVAAKPEPEPTPEPTPKPGAGGRANPTPRPATRTVVTRPTSSTWLAAEKYLLSLLNCTRGGGWVLADGSCSEPGGSGIAPLKYDAGISDEVARPYAKRLAGSGVCSHFYGGGSPGDRLQAAGYTSYHWAENIGCRYYNDPRDAAVGLVRFYQSEKFWSPVGGHYVNMMNRAYDRAGVGLWVSGGNLNFVVNFYRP